MAAQLSFRTNVAGARVAVQTPSRSVAVRAPLCVESYKKARKVQQVVLKEDIPGTGAAGELVNVKLGFWRNCLAPGKKAEPATPEVLAAIQADVAAAKEAAENELNLAKALATALTTIGKFTVKKKVGEEDKIFGSVTTAEICDVMKMQMGRDFDKSAMTLPEIKTLGEYEATVKLHPKVTGAFKVVVVKDKEAQ